MSPNWTAPIDNNERMRGVFWFFINGRKNKKQIRRRRKEIRKGSRSPRTVFMSPNERDHKIEARIR
jgi:hypothetical protein